MVRTKRIFAVAIIAGGVAAGGNAAELQRSTADAWQEYVRGARARMQERLDGSKPFLWMTEVADRGHRVQGGEVVVAPLVGHGTQPVPGGLIHDWVGAAFIPNATIETLLSVVHDYDRYKTIFKPVVTDSRTLDAGDSEQVFSMVWQRHVLFVNAAMQGRYHARDVMLNPNRGYSIVEATTLQEIEGFGRPGEHLLPPDTGGGFIWRIYSISRYEERGGGVYLEIEAIALSRDVPSSMRWLVNPVVNHLSVNSLTTTLQQTREAVERQQVARDRLVASDRKGMN